MRQEPNSKSNPAPGMAEIVDRNIWALLERRRQEDQRKHWQDRVAERITAFTGSLRFVYIHVVIYALWIIENVGWIPFLPRFDPSFSILAMVASVEAIFLSTFILITQNRMQVMADQRADLDLQISLLAEHEVTRLIHLVSAMAERMGVQEATSPELEELKQDIRPEKVLDRIEEAAAGEELK